MVVGHREGCKTHPTTNACSTQFDSRPASGHTSSFYHARVSDASRGRSGRHSDSDATTTTHVGKEGAPLDSTHSRSTTAAPHISKTGERLPRLNEL
jgi:hypothetical protein